MRVKFVLDLKKIRGSVLFRKEVSIQKAAKFLACVIQSEAITLEVKQIDFAGYHIKTLDFWRLDDYGPYDFLKRYAILRHTILFGVELGPLVNHYKISASIKEAYFVIFCIIRDKRHKCFVARMHDGIFKGNVLSKKNDPGF